MCGENKGIIFDVSRYCLNDGPGIRTTVFLKGCPLRCSWCHNPESQKMTPEILFSQSSCINCGACSVVCPNQCHSLEDLHIFDRSRCTVCGKCVEACAKKALRIVGKESTVEEIISEVLKDKTFYATSGGGITVSGGEPTLQVDFLEKLLTLAKKEGIHTAVETCGYAPQENFERIAPLTDCFLFDYKETSPEKHINFTGKDRSLIMQNLELLNRIGAYIILRVPLIPGYNDTLENIEGIKVTAKKYPSIRKIEILPYHPLGVSKEKELGWENKNTIEMPDKKLIDDFLGRVLEGLEIKAELCV